MSDQSTEFSATNVVYPALAVAGTGLRLPQLAEHLRRIPTVVREVDPVIAAGDGPATGFSETGRT